MLDGLHEDLNRIKRKPYIGETCTGSTCITAYCDIEERDSDGRTDLDIAEEQWSIHLQRNRSIVVDLLQGQLKSTLQCSECNYRSVRFDPFMYLTLVSYVYEHAVARLTGMLAIGVPVRPVWSVQPWRRGRLIFTGRAAVRTRSLVLW